MGQRQRRAGRLIGSAGAVGVFLTMSLAPAAHADIDDLFAPFFDLVSGADFAAPAAAVVTPDNWLEDLSHPLQGLEQLFGGHEVAAPAAVESSIAPASAPVDDGLAANQVHLDVTPSATDSNGASLGGGEPVATVAVGGGDGTRVLVDTGSNGLVIPWQDVKLSGLDWKDFNPFTDIGFGSFAGGVGYVYLQLPTTVDFGNGLVADGAPVDVALLSFPVSLNALLGGDWTLHDMLGPADAQGIMGIGAPLSGHENISPVLWLKDGYNEGVLIDQKNETLTFGPHITGADDVVIGTDKDSYSNLQVSIQNPGASEAHDYGTVSSLVDSGGVFGTLPTNVFGGTAGNVLAPGSIVTVSDGQGHELYSYEVQTHPTVDGKGFIDGPTFVSGDNAVMNTGNWLFDQHPVYVGYGTDGSVTYTVIPTVEAGNPGS